MNKQKISMILALILPVLAIMAICGTVFPRQHKLAKLETENRTALADQKRMLQQLEAIEKMPANPRIATLAPSREEQSGFLRGLAALCTGSGNRILAVGSLAAPKPQEGSSAPVVPINPPGMEPLPGGVQEIRSTLMYEGSFASCRAFLRCLERCKRLITVPACQIGPAQSGFPNISTTITIVRYVDAPIVAATPGVTNGSQTSSKK